MSYAGTSPPHGTNALVTAIAGADGFTLNGRADHVPFGTADALVVVARVETGRTVFLVDAHQDSIDREPIEVVGPEPYHQVRFNDTTVPHDAVLGQPGSGREVVEMIETFGAAATCAEMVGGAQRVLDMTVEFQRAVVHLPEVVECHHVAATYDYLLRVEVADLAAYEVLHSNSLAALPGIAHVTTIFSMDELKSAQTLAQFDR